MPPVICREIPVFDDELVGNIRIIERTACSTCLRFRRELLSPIDILALLDERYERQETGEASADPAKPILPRPGFEARYLILVQALGLLDRLRQQPTHRATLV